MLAATASGDRAASAQPGPVGRYPGRVRFADLDHQVSDGLIGVAKQPMCLGLDLLVVRRADGGLQGLG
jgi:hypothetical protein